MKYSIFSAPGVAERLLEWGGASARPRAEIFLRGGGGGAGAACPPSVCLSVCVCVIWREHKNRTFCTRNFTHFAHSGAKTATFGSEKNL